MKKGDLIAKWDPFNAVIVTEYAGTLRFNDVIEGITFRAETDEATGLTEKIITDSKDKSKVPTCDVLDKNGEIIGTYNFPVGGHVVCEDGQTSRLVLRSLRFLVLLVQQAISPVVFHVLLSCSRPATRLTLQSFQKSTVRLQWVRLSVATVRSRYI